MGPDAIHRAEHSGLTTMAKRGVIQFNPVPKFRISKPGFDVETAALRELTTPMYMIRLTTGRNGTHAFRLKRSK